MRRLLPVLLPAVAALLAACGGSGSSSPTQSAASKPCPSGAVVIHMKDIRFAPEKASAKVGQTVCWTNDDDVQHDAVDENGGAFKSALFGKGGTFAWKAAKAGAISYVCTVHPGMTAKLDVTS
jgi:plastocyanin